MLQLAIRRSRYPRPGGSLFVPYICTFCVQIPKPRAFTSTSRHGASASPHKSVSRKKKSKATNEESEKAAEISGEPISILGEPISSAMRQRGTVEKERFEGLSPRSDRLEAIQADGQPEVDRLSHGLDRVLFNPNTIHWLQDPRSGVYNFDPYLQNIMPVTEFDFDATASYVISSNDEKLENIARKYKKKYVGSTSSMTATLIHMHFLLSQWRGLNVETLSKGFEPDFKTFSKSITQPASIFLRYKGDGLYAIDPDKAFDEETVLSWLGRSMEKLLTVPPEEFEKYRRGNSQVVTGQNVPDTYNYSAFGDFMLRSQLDAYDPRLPGTGMFDLKTRAVVSVRMNVSDFHLYSGYHIKHLRGQWESFEREEFDLMRTAYLKYSLQARIGRMDGIFVAYHNTEKIFGFRYIPLDEMDTMIHGKGGPFIAEKEFKLSLQLLNKILDKVTAAYPKQSLRIFFETRETTQPFMYIFAQPLSEEKIEQLQVENKQSIESFMDELREKIEIGKTHARQQMGLDPEEPQLTEFSDRLEAAKARVNAQTDCNIEHTLLGDGSGTPMHHVFEDQENRAAGHNEEDGSIVKIEDNADASNKMASELAFPGVVPGTVGDPVTKGEENTIEDSHKEDAAKEEDSPISVMEDISDDEDEDTNLGEDTELDTGVDGVDEEFLAKIVAEEDKNASNGEVIAMTLTTKNYVNGVAVARPYNLGPKDKWTVDYSIAEMPTQTRAWRHYKASKKRKLRRMSNAAKETELTKRFRELSLKGRLWDMEKRGQGTGSG